MKLSPSVLSADFARLGSEAQSVADADMLHIDVMDGLFVPNLSIGLPVVESLKKAVALPLDVHLMIVDPERYIARFAQAGAAMITVHVEATKDLPGCLSAIRGAGCMASAALKPGTSASALTPYLDRLDAVLVMTVEPGFGGQKLMPECLEKCAQLRAAGFKGQIEADGGIAPDNIALVRQSGVDIAVVGSALFGRPERERAAVIEQIKHIGDQA